MKLSTCLLALSLVFSTVMCSADDGAVEIISKNLRELDPDLVPNDISPSPIPGLYQVIIGAEVIYASADGKYIVQGEMFKISDKENVKSITEDIESNARADILSALSDEETIDFAPEQVDDTIYVFTDITCGYCRKLHRDVTELNKHGISVKYLAYPRGGVSTTGGFELSAVWCADDRNQAMTDAKSGVSVEMKDCDNPVARHYSLGNSFGVSGTPAIFLKNGFRVPGYLPPERLLKMIRDKSS